MNKRSKESKAAFEAGLSAMRLAMRGDHISDARIESITRRARYIYAVSTLTLVAGFQADDNRPPGLSRITPATQHDQRSMKTETPKTESVPTVVQSPPVRHLWVQYAYEDTLNAAIIQTADTEEEAREENETVMSGCCWYRYDIAPGEGGGNLINGDGPHYLTNSGVITQQQSK